MHRFVDNQIRIVIDDFAFDAGDRFTYEYSFFEHWLHDIRVEAINETSTLKAPFCISGHGMPGVTAADECDKTLAAGDTVFPEDRDAERTYGTWIQRLAKAANDSPSVTAGELYKGQHWSRAVAAAARIRTELWIISTGLGFLHATDPVVPYEATVADMPLCHRGMWEWLTARPPSKRRFNSLKTLMQTRPEDRFVVAASPMYLCAVESDLLAGRAALRSVRQSSLKDSVRYTSASMMKTLTPT